MADPLKLTRNDVALVNQGDVIVLPKQMTPAEGIIWLHRKMQEEEKVVQVKENFEGYFPLDSALAFAAVLRKRFGWVSFDGAGFRPPQMLTVPVDHTGRTEQVPWGSFQIPGVEGATFIASGAMDRDYQPIFTLVGNVKQKDKLIVSELAQQAREFLKTNSIYRGKAIKVDFPNFKETEYDPQVHVPSFLATQQVSEASIIFNKKVQNAVEVAIFNKIKYGKLASQLGTSPRRGVLMGGRPGTGKTLLASIVQRLCADTNRTFIYLSKTSDFAQGMRFAKAYQPALIFAEDLDSLVGEERNTTTNEVLNTLDGVDSKRDDVMVVFTTNFPEKINEAMLRPGRLDVVIHTEPPDAQAVEALIRMYGAGLISESADLKAVSHTLAGNIPAVVREVVERAKLASLSSPERRRLLETGGKFYLTQEDLDKATDSMINHLELLNRPRSVDSSALEKSFTILGQRVVDAAEKVMNRGDVRGSVNALVEHAQAGKPVERV